MQEQGTPLPTALKDDEIGLSWQFEVEERPALFWPEGRKTKALLLQEAPAAVDRPGCYLS